ncbi:MAG: lysozyme family protein [Bilifractor sp.]|jgi:hypothetical protein
MSEKSGYRKTKNSRKRRSSWKRFRRKFIRFWRMFGRAVRYLYQAGGKIVIPAAALIVVFVSVGALEQNQKISEMQKVTGKDTTITIRKNLVSDQVEAYSDVIQKYADEYSVSDYTGLIKAIMMQESRGDGTDPMQASASFYNERYAGQTITDPNYSIRAGVRELAAALKAAEVQGPDDIERISLAVQGYNYGPGYIDWAKKNYGGYSAENAATFSNMKAYENGWSSYGDPDYVEHVLRYYSYSYSISGYSISGENAVKSESAFAASAVS